MHTISFKNVTLLRENLAYFLFFKLFTFKDVLNHSQLPHFLRYHSFFTPLFFSRFFLCFTQLILSITFVLPTRLYMRSTISTTPITTYFTLPTFSFFYSIFSFLSFTQSIFYHSFLYYPLGPICDRRRSRFLFGTHSRKPRFP